MLTREDLMQAARSLAVLDDPLTEDQAESHVRALFTTLYDAYMSDFSVDDVLDIFKTVGDELAAVESLYG